MNDALKALTAFLQHVSAIGFGLVGVFALLVWWRNRTRGNAYLALALGLLGAVSLVGEFQRDVGLTRLDGSSTAPPVVAAIVTCMTLLMFLGCGYALLLFRSHLLHVRPLLMLGVALLLFGLSFSFIPFSLDPGFGKRNPGLSLGLLALLFLAWSLTAGEPVYRLWRLSRSRPAVQRARLRALAAGFGLIIAVLVLAVGAASISARSGSFGTQAAWFPLLLQLFTLLSIPVLAVSFAPPRWLRRSWRASEEHAFNEALHDLLLYSPSTAVLAERALGWAIRLVGADGGVMLDATGAVLARRDLAEHLVPAVAASSLSPDGAATRLPDGQLVVALPLTLAGGTGRMVVLAGALTPALGDEEGVRLSQYSISVAAALDRVTLVEAVRRSEEELRDVNRDLEARVLRRTSELELSNRELQSANRELEAFSYTVSHDLRSPLRAIDGFTRILNEEYADSLEPPARRYLDLVAENARGMGSLIDTMLTFSRLSRQALVLQQVDPGEVARRVAERNLVGLDDRRITLDVQPMPTCESDPVLLEQVFGNLVDNAVKFTRSREEAVITIGSVPDPDHPEVTAYFVRDNGVGFDPRYIHKLFGVFQRLHRAEEYEGFGAGLAIVERIVTRHGGRAWAETVQGSGATFYFTLRPAPLPVA